MYVCMYVYVYVCRPLTHRGQVYQQLTYVLAGRFLEGPRIPKKGLHRILRSATHRLESQPASQPAKPMTGLFYPQLAVLGLYMYVPMYEGLSPTVASFISNAHTSKPLS